MDFKKIKEEYRYTTELHSHTNPASDCGKLTPELNVRLYANLGCSTLTITNHLSNFRLGKFPTDAELAEFYVADYYRAKKAAEGTSLNVALGVELRFLNDYNDYLFYGFEPSDVEKMIYYLNKDVQSFYRDFKNSKNVLIHAHPFRNNMHPTPLGYVDGIEAFNMHPGANSRIGIATRFAAENDLLVTAGSDYHDPGRHALVLMRTKHELRDSFDVADAIKSRDVLFDMSGNIIIPYLW